MQVHRTLGWGIALAVVCGAAIAHGQRAGTAAAIGQLGLAGAANANPTIDARGQFVAVAWGATISGKGTDVYVAVSRDAGATFGAPVRANSDPGEARTSAERPPVVVLVPSARQAPDVAVLWTAGATDPTLKVARSSDGGRTFARPRGIAASGARGNRGWAAMTSGADGSLHVVWLDHREAVAAAGTAGSGHQHGGTAAPAADGVAMAQRSGLYYARIDDGPVAERLLARGV